MGIYYRPDRFILAKQAEEKAKRGRSWRPAFLFAQKKKNVMTIAQQGMQGKPC
ncbi:MAG: hypothetical protein LBE55_06135 [Clostridiales bacterium]|nr:hypothetical protein [Clostridiales bacterium]